MMELLLEISAPRDSDRDSDLDRHERRTRLEQDEAFCDLMRWAVAQGLEHPPMIGIDTRPCTSKPIVLSR